MRCRRQRPVQVGSLCCVAARLRRLPPAASVLARLPTCATASLLCFHSDARIRSEASTGYEGGSLEEAWRAALFRLFDELPAEQRARVSSVAIDGTSSTTLLIDGDTGRCLAPPKMYNEAQGAAAVARAKAMAPPDHTATAPTSTLCKVLEWDEAGAWQAAAATGVEPAIVHQAGGLCGVCMEHVVAEMRFPDCDATDTCWGGRHSGMRCARWRRNVGFFFFPALLPR